MKHIIMTLQVEDDGKGWVWLAAEMSPGGLAVELFKSVPFGKRAILVAKQSNVDELFQKVNWDTALANIEVTFGGPQAPRRPRGMKPSKAVAFDSPIFGNWMRLVI